MVWADVLKRGITKGLKTVVALAKVMVPIYITISVLGQTPFMPWLAHLAKPVTGLLGLPGEAATALVLGNVLNLYGAIGAIGALQLDAREITVLALVLLISHSLFVETAVSKKTGINVKSLVLVRIIGGLLAGMVLNWGWQLWMR